MKDPIVQIGKPVLRQKATPVLQKDFGSKRIHALILKMSRVLSAEEYGVAIAAPQIGISERIFVIAGRAFIADQKNKDDVETPKDMAFINPEIIRLSRKKREMSEGCLSVRGKYGTVTRHERTSVRARDESGVVFTYHGTGLIAHIFQHECDHLDGILYTDKALKLEDEAKRDELRAKHPAGSSRVLKDVDAA